MDVAITLLVDNSIHSVCPLYQLDDKWMTDTFNFVFHYLIFKIHKKLYV